MSSSYFITGTDTEIGKTWCTLALIQYFKNQGLRVAGMKPIASGCDCTKAGFRNSDAKQILEITNKYSIPMDDLKGLGEQLDAAGIGYRPYELYSGTGSDAGIDFSDLIAGGLGTAYDWTKDVNAKLKDSFLVGTGVENQASKIVEENKKLADSLGIVKNSNITTEKGIDSSYFTALNGRTFVVKNGQVASWYSTKADAQKYQSENGGVIIDTNKQNTLDLNSSYLSSEYLLNTYISKAKTQNTTTHTLSDLLNI